MHSRSFIAPRKLAVAAIALAFVGVALVCCNGATHDTGQCTPRAGATPVSLPNYGGFYVASDLPSGSCSDEGAICKMGALATYFYCDQDGGHVPADAGGTLVACSYSEFQCTCRDQTWTCENVSVGASACGCTQLNREGDD